MSKLLILPAFPQTQRRYFPLWKIMFKPIFVIILGNEMSLQYAFKYCVDLMHLGYSSAVTPKIMPTDTKPLILSKKDIHISRDRRIGEGDKVSQESHGHLVITCFLEKVMETKTSSLKCHIILPRMPLSSLVCHFPP